MTVSVFDLFSIGIGPSSSHTVGPMRAAYRFTTALKERNQLSLVSRIKIDLYGSLALTGIGHATDCAVLLGAEGNLPEAIDPNRVRARVEEIRQLGKICLSGVQEVAFQENNDLFFHKEKQLPAHPNGMRFTVYGNGGEELCSEVYYSIGGGFILDHHQMQNPPRESGQGAIPFPFLTGDALLKVCEQEKKTIAEIMMANEKAHRSEAQIREGILKIWGVMRGCIARGAVQEGILPGGLGVRRRAAGIFRHLEAADKKGIQDPVAVMKWVSAWALAVNEENAAGGRVVTAPTNGAAGVIPSVLHYYQKFVPEASEEGIITFLLTAGAMGILYKSGASISAAEMGCMGEVGVACSMAAAGLTAALGGSIYQVEDAAEIGMEHNLGLTCDPVMGLVQIPCIERNTMGAVKAINAALLALEGDGKSRVSLDQVIATMRQTGRDMQTIYKETSLGGLAVNVPEC